VKSCHNDKNYTQNINIIISVFVTQLDDTSILFTAQGAPIKTIPRENALSLELQQLSFANSAILAEEDSRHIISEFRCHEFFD